MTEEFSTNIDNIITSVDTLDKQDEAYKVDKKATTAKLKILKQKIDNYNDHNEKLDYFICLAIGLLIGYAISFI